MIGTYEEYQRRWNKKAKQYEEEGKLYLCINEEEIMYLNTTIDRIIDQAKLWCERIYGKERLEIIKIDEEKRRQELNQ